MVDMYPRVVTFVCYVRLSDGADWPTHVCMRACMHACVRAWARACMRACARVLTLAGYISERVNDEPQSTRGRSKYSTYQNNFKAGRKSSSLMNLCGKTRLLHTVQASHGSRACFWCVGFYFSLQRAGGCLKYMQKWSKIMKSID